MKRVILATTAVCAVAVARLPAVAADLPSRYAPPLPYDDPAPVFTWSGLYAGINGQLGVGGYTAASRSFGSPFGGLGGATLGYNYQQGKLLVGAEGDIAFGSISGSNGGTNTSTSAATHGLGTARVRVGYVWDRALLYVTGGYAGTQLNGKLNDFNGSPNLQLEQSHYLNGFAAGLGVEYALTTRISVKGEYLFSGFASTTYFGGTRDGTGLGQNVNLLRAGVNYHF